MKQTHELAACLLMLLSLATRRYVAQKKQLSALVQITRVLGGPRTLNEILAQGSIDGDLLFQDVQLRLIGVQHQASRSTFRRAILQWNWATIEGEKNSTL
jgi:hypothetical protein